jgi:hypothetical protein
VVARQQVPVPAQHRLGAHQQPEPAKHIPWEPVQQGGQERSWVAVKTMDSPARRAYFYLCCISE